MTADIEQYSVVSNHEGQHSVWFAGRELPAGWNESGFSGSKDECLAHIGEVWTDLTPRSVRRGR
ncbi:MbtH family NRPS accessory protein [Streptomyces sp. NPDC048680]|uniref:MbtH family protein n=1 Tax=Streptomyces sp. NPDC048680 TaxID=3155492 RepID=UPI0034363FF9